MAPANAEDPSFKDLLGYIKRTRGFDFSGYKRTTLARRIVKRMQEVGVGTYADYLDLLEATPDELATLFNTILINVTCFFRDPPIWDYVREELVPQLLDRAGARAPIRVWSAGCATGEEPYTLAMVLAQALGEEQYLQRVKIFATDIDEPELERARHAVYTERQIGSVPAQLIERFFEPVNGSFMFRKDLRRSVIFGRNDLTRDAPISRLDLLTCRNTLMYFNSETQHEILRRMHMALRDDGYLVLGKSEMLLAFADAFAPVNLSKRVFCKVPDRNLRPAAQMPSIAPISSRPGPTGADTHLRTAFSAGPVAQLVIDENGKVVLANERMRQLFDLADSDIGRPLQDLQLSYRPIELRSLIDTAESEGKPAHVEQVAWTGPDEIARQFEVDVIPLTDHAKTNIGTSVAFTDITQYRRVWEEFQQSKHDLESAYEELQSTVEELETTNEELQSTNEELETTNEELQSTNEELETMNEELQSSNEELEATNEELRLRTGELNYANLLMDSMLASVGVAVAVVDRDMRIQMWNDHAKELWGLDISDVRGRHFLDLDIGLPIEHLRAPLSGCLLDRKAPAGALRVPARDRRGRDIVCDVRCMPLPNSDGVDGAIVVMEALPSTGG